MDRRNIAVAFLSAVPATPEFTSMKGYSQAGNLACLGLVEALHSSGVGLGQVYGFTPLSIFPRNRCLIYPHRKLELFPRVKACLFTTFNVFPFRNWCRYISVMLAMISWSLRNLGKHRVFVMYNVFFPHVLFMRMIAWLTHTKLVLVVYEIGTVKNLDLGWAHRLLEPQWLKRLGEKCLKIVDGRIFITDAIARDFTPGRHYIRIDGGVTSQVVERLPDLSARDGGDEFRMMFAGGVTEWNGIPLMLEYMKVNLDPKLRLWVAGSGGLLPMVENAAKEDARIVYKGMLSHDGLFKLYEQADVLLNLRDMSDPVMAYHYPSKFLEILTVGKPVIATDAVHTREAYGDLCFVMQDFSLKSFIEEVDRIRAMSAEERIAFGIKTRSWMLANKTWKAQGPLIRKYIEDKVVGGIR